MKKKFRVNYVLVADDRRYIFIAPGSAPVRRSGADVIGFDHETDGAIITDRGMGTISLFWDDLQPIKKAQ